MSAFADASALVKLYADEAGHEAIRALDAIAISQISRVEVPAALWRKQRLGELTGEDAGTLTADFEADYYGTDNEMPRFAAVAVTIEVLEEAARVCTTRGLRAYDAVQLSSALAARRADPGCATVAVFDRALRLAAAAEGFVLIPLESRDASSR